MQRRFFGTCALGVLLVSRLAHARGGGFSSEAMQAQEAGSSRASLLGSFSPRQELLRISNFSMITTPGVSLRNVVSFSFQLAPGMSLGPSFDFSEKLSGDRLGFSWNDPALKFSASGLQTGITVAGEPVRAEFGLSAQAPVSENSRSVHMKSTIAATLVPRMRLRNSRFSVQGLLTLKTSIVERGDQAGLLYPSFVFSGLQGTYQASAKTSGFLMFHVAKIVGPEMPLGNSASPAFLKQMAGKAPFGLTPGLTFRPGGWTSISPRINWSIGEPLDSMTFAINANLQLI